MGEAEKVQINQNSLSVVSKFPYQDNRNEFTYGMLRKNSEELKSHDFIEPGAILVFPKNYDFISRLSKPYVKSLTRHGWEIAKTIFLEIPYVVTFTQELDPSLVQVWLTCVPSKKSIFRTVVFTKGYIPNTNRIELEDTIIHEQIHMREDEPKLLKGLSISVDYDKNEERVEGIVKDVLLKKYGDAVYEAERNAFLFAFETQRKTKTISSGFLEYWIHLYFLDKFEEYADFAIKMDDRLESQEYLDGMNKTYDKVSQLYKERFNFELRSLA